MLNVLLVYLFLGHTLYATLYFTGTKEYTNCETFLDKVMFRASQVFGFGFWFAFKLLK